jgi:Carbohydrate family 9 binding domain-like
MPRCKAVSGSLGLLALAAGVPACSEPVAAPVPVVEGADEAEAWAHAITFEGGVTLDAITTPDSVEPGGTLHVDVRVEGPIEGLRARVIVWPPRAGARQVALGGMGAPPPQVPLDPRARVVELPLVAGVQSLALPVPAPWFAPQVLVTLELLAGDRRVPAGAGPRREDGVAMLALVDVPARPPTFVAPRVQVPPVIDGRTDDPAWVAVERHPLVHSLDGEPYDERPGRVRLAWDATALYVAADIEDPDVWSEYGRRDDPLWNQEVFELFVFGDAERRDYLELQVSPRGTVFDARFAHYRKGDEAWNGRWQAAVELRGTLDDRRDRDEGWSAELAIPWAEICLHTEVTCPPAPGQTLRINAFRFERPRGAPPSETLPAVGLALAPPRVPDFHAPELAAVLELGGA